MSLPELLKVAHRAGSGSPSTRQYPASDAVTAKKEIQIYVKRCVLQVTAWRMAHCVKSYVGPGRVFTLCRKNWTT